MDSFQPGFSIQAHMLSTAEVCVNLAFSICSCRVTKSLLSYPTFPRESLAQCPHVKGVCLFAAFSHVRSYLTVQTYASLCDTVVVVNTLSLLISQCVLNTTRKQSVVRLQLLRSTRVLSHGTGRGGGLFTRAAA